MVLWSMVRYECVFLRLCAHSTSYSFSFGCCGQNWVTFTALSTSITLKVPPQESGYNKVLAVSHLREAGLFLPPHTINLVC